jgi:tetratricopeptide (TPR) repeat protein
VRAHYDLAWAYHHAADVLKAQGQLDQALENYGQALKIREELTAADKTNKRWRKDLALSYSVLAEGESQTNPDAAAKHYAAARSILEELTANDPSNVSWWEQLTLTCNGEALLAKSRGDLESALARYQQALDIRRRLLDRNPNEADRLAAVATSEFLVGDVLQRRNDFAAARDHYERSLDLRRAILEKSSDDANQRKELEKVDQALASLPASTQVPSPDAARAESTP